MSRGRFITLEGVDGAGKSTHMAWIAERLRTPGRKVLVTREPGGTPLAERLRALVLTEHMDPIAETMLLFAARADHVQREIGPALDSGAWCFATALRTRPSPTRAAARASPRS